MDVAAAALSLLRLSGTRDTVGDAACQDPRRHDFCLAAGGQWSEEKCSCSWPSTIAAMAMADCVSTIAAAPSDVLGAAFGNASSPARVGVVQPVCCPLLVAERSNASSLCEATVWDRTLQARVVIDEHGCVPFHLPPGYSTTAHIQCSDAVTVSTTGRRSVAFTMPTRGRRPHCRDAMGFHPGFYHDGRWHAACHAVQPCHWPDGGWGREGNSSGMQVRSWIQLVGDSVTRDLFTMISLRLRLSPRTWSLPLSIGFDHAEAWSPDGLVITYQALPGSEFGLQVDAWGGSVLDANYAAVQALRPRESTPVGPSPTQPVLPGSAVPNITVFSLGYHHSSMDTAGVRDKVRQLFSSIRERSNGDRSNKRRWKYLLNFAPDTKQIPEKYEV